jgi:hypothetical protein
MDRAALRMLCSPQFWRMAVLWAISLLYSYLLLFLGGRAAAPPRRRQMPGAGRRPICVVTGVSSMNIHVRAYYLGYVTSPAVAISGDVGAGQGGGGGAGPGGLPRRAW